MDNNDQRMEPIYAYFKWLLESRASLRGGDKISPAVERMPVCHRGRLNTLLEQLRGEAACFKAFDEFLMGLTLIPSPRWSALEVPFDKFERMNFDTLPLSSLLLAVFEYQGLGWELPSEKSLAQFLLDIAEDWQKMVKRSFPWMRGHSETTPTVFCVLADEIATPWGGRLLPFQRPTKGGIPDAQLPGEDFKISLDSVRGYLVLGEKGQPSEKQIMFHPRWEGDILKDGDKSHHQIEGRSATLAIATFFMLERLNERSHGKLTHNYDWIVATGSGQGGEGFSIEMVGGESEKAKALLHAAFPGKGLLLVGGCDTTLQSNPVEEAKVLEHWGKVIDKARKSLPTSPSGEEPPDFDIKVVYSLEHLEEILCKEVGGLKKSVDLISNTEDFEKKVGESKKKRQLIRMVVGMLLTVLTLTTGYDLVATASTCAKPRDGHQKLCIINNTDSNFLGVVKYNNNLLIKKKGAKYKYDSNFKNSVLDFLKEKLNFQTLPILSFEDAKKRDEVNVYFYPGENPLKQEIFSEDNTTKLFAFFAHLAEIEKESQKNESLLKIMEEMIHLGTLNEFMWNKNYRSSVFKSINANSISYKKHGVKPIFMGSVDWGQMNNPSMPLYRALLGVIMVNYLAISNLKDKADYVAKMSRYIKSTSDFPIPKNERVFWVEFLRSILSMDKMIKNRPDVIWGDSLDNPSFQLVSDMKRVFPLPFGGNESDQNKMVFNTLFVFFKPIVAPVFMELEKNANSCKVQKEYIELCRALAEIKKFHGKKLTNGDKLVRLAKAMSPDSFKNISQRDLNAISSIVDKSGLESDPEFIIGNFFVCTITGLLQPSDLFDRCDGMIHVFNLYSNVLSSLQIEAKTSTKLSVSLKKQLKEFGEINETDFYQFMNPFLSGVDETVYDPKEAEYLCHTDVMEKLSVGNLLSLEPPFDIGTYYFLLAACYGDSGLLSNKAKLFLDEAGIALKPSAKKSSFFNSYYNSFLRQEFPTGIFSVALPYYVNSRDSVYIPDGRGVGKVDLKIYINNSDFRSDGPIQIHLSYPQCVSEIRQDIGLLWKGKDGRGKDIWESLPLNDLKLRNGFHYVELIFNEKNCGKEAVKIDVDIKNTKYHDGVSFLSNLNLSEKRLLSVYGKKFEKSL